jgi:threonine dehydrogenase-like Zn-dependent dehydrogenase
MFGMPGQPWGGLLSDVVKVPYARAMLTLLPHNLPAHAFVGLSCNLPLVCQALSPHSLSSEGDSVLVVGGPGGLGLYAVAMAFALGARRVDYFDEHGKRGDLAAALGASVLTTAPPRSSEYSLAVVASVDPALLLAAVRALRPEGACEVLAPYLSSAPLPLTELFFKGVTLRFSRHASQESALRALELLALGRIAVDTIQGEALPWESLPEALASPSPKPVFVRARSTHS